MTIIVRGSKQVAEFERALCGSPSSTGLQTSRAALTRYLSERVESRRAAQAERAQLTEPLLNLALSHIAQDDPRWGESIEARKAVYARRSKQKLTPPKREKFEAQVRLGSIQAVKVPPYDSDWSWPDTASRVEANADKASGTYHLQMGSVGEHWQDVAAGICVRFAAPVDDPQQRVAALIDYSDFWMDDAFGYVAYNNFKTHLWVWSEATQGWVSTPDVSPQWSDGVGWFEEHGSNGDGSEEDGRISVETRFPAFANTWYQAWVWSQVSVYADGGFWGNAFSFTHYETSVPLMVFGSL